MKFEIIHDLAASSRHPWRVRGRYNIPLTSRLAQAVKKELEKMSGISCVYVNPLTRRILFYADSAEQKDAAIEYLEHGFQWTENLRITAEEVERLLTGESPVGAFIGLARYFILRPLLPPSWRMIVSVISALPFLAKGSRSLLKGKLNVDVLDASALFVSILRKDYGTIGMLTMLLAVGEALEIWTRQTSFSSLCASLALDVDLVWKIDRNGKEIRVPMGQIARGDLVVVKDGSAIPVDGIVESGQALVNQASMTGEPIPVLRDSGGAVFAGTIVEAGSIVIRVTQVGEETRLNKLISFIQQSEVYKSKLETHYTKLADKAVPYTFGLAALVFLFTRNLMRASSVLLVDYSCALKLATPLAVLAAMRIGAKQGIAIKGGKYLEAIKNADTLVFDKTGTLTSAHPKVVSVIAAPGYDRKEGLRIMACLEEHFPHPVSRAIVNEALREGLEHEEEHAQVEYVVAHGIVSTLHGKHMYLGSRHYLEHDKGVDLSIFNQDIARETGRGNSLLFLAENRKSIGMVVIEDPLRPEAHSVIEKMRKLGFRRILMLTGDDQRTARAVAEKVGIREFRAHVLPAEKGDLIQKLQSEGFKVMMVGDGINDGPALSSASVGIAMGDGTDLARAVANVLLTRPTLEALPIARKLSEAAIGRIHFDVGMAIGLNSIYLLGAILGIFNPAVTAILHNATTLAISLNAIRPYWPDDEDYSRS